MKGRGLPQIFLVAMISLLHLNSPFVADAENTARPIQNKNQKLLLAGAELELGMPKEQVLASITKDYEKDTGGSDDFFPIREGEGKGKRMIGYVRFREGRLINAMKDWGSFSAVEGDKFGQALLSAIIGMQKEWKQEVKIQTVILSQPNVTLNTITIYYGEKHIAIGIDQGAGGGNYVREYLWQKR